MPTKDWLKQNPKVSAHISQELYQQLQEFMEQHGITRTSEALKQILIQYFGNGVDYLEGGSSQPVDKSTKERLNALEITVGRVLQQLNKFENDPLNPMTRVVANYSEKDEIEILKHKVDILSEQIEETQNRAKIYYGSPQVDHPVEYSKEKGSQLVVNSSSPANLEEWLTTGEAHIEAQRRGYQKAKSSMRRDLKSGAIPEDLKRLGLVANWEVRQQANPKDNSVRWLRFND